jgi:hypothetical protein
MGLIERYIATRDAFATRIEGISRQLSEWTEAHSKIPPTLMDIALFEGIRAQRARLLAEFTEVEDEFVVQMLRALGGEPIVEAH